MLRLPLPPAIKGTLHLPQILLEALNFHLILCNEIWSYNVFTILIHDDNDVFYTG